MDRDRSRANQAAAHFGIAYATTSLDALVAQGLDAVVIATPHNTHYPLARAALRAGLDVLVEKPMVIEPSQGRELVEIARQEGRKIHVGYPYPHSEHAQHLRSVISGGELGELTLVTSLFATPPGSVYRGRTPHGGDDALFPYDPANYSRPGLGGHARSQLTHSISLLIHITGIRPTEVFAHTASPDLSVDMVDAGAFTAEGGTIGTVAGTGAVVPAVERLEIFGTEGHAELDTGLGRLEVRYYDGRHETFPVLTGEGRYPERTPARHLVDCFLDDTDVVADGQLGYITAAFVDAFLTSARDHHPIPVNVDLRVGTGR